MLGWVASKKGSSSCHGTLLRGRIRKPLLVERQAAGLYGPLLPRPRWQHWVGSFAGEQILSIKMKRGSQQLLSIHFIYFLRLSIVHPPIYLICLYFPNIFGQWVTLSPSKALFLFPVSLEEIHTLWLAISFSFLILFPGSHRVLAVELWTMKSHRILVCEKYAPAGWLGCPFQLWSSPRKLLLHW